MTEAIKNLMVVVDEIVGHSKIFSVFTGEPIVSYAALMKEYEALENEIKKEIKEWGAEISETKYFSIRQTVTYEYVPEILLDLVPEALAFIEVKKTVLKAKIDKAIKDGVIDERAKDALKIKGKTISFIDKQKIAEREVKEISV